MKVAMIKTDWQYENTKQIAARFTAKLDANPCPPPNIDANQRMAWELGRVGMQGILNTLQEQLRYYEARRGAYLGHPGVPKNVFDRTPAT